MRNQQAQRPAALQPGDARCALAEEELMALWAQAWNLAQRLCGGSLRRLRQGDGGFYTADDLQQDLFLEFWGLACGWRAGGAPEESLWAAWRRKLWGQGQHVLRRSPQRLWARAERSWAPESLALDVVSDDADGTSLPASARAALTAPEDAAATHEGLAALDDLEAALWALRPAQRQVLYMLTLAGRSAGHTGRLLRLNSRNTLYQRLYAARRALLRRLRSLAAEEKER